MKRPLESYHEVAPFRSQATSPKPETQTHCVTWLHIPALHVHVHTDWHFSLVPCIRASSKEFPSLFQQILDNNARYELSASLEQGLRRSYQSFSWKKKVWALSASMRAFVIQQSSVPSTFPSFDIITWNQWQMHFSFPAGTHKRNK